MKTAPNLISNHVATVTLETVAPQDAKTMLLSNTKNRPLRSKTLVARIANDIKQGRWQLNGDTIRFSSDGVLLDGQHRLHAIIEAEQPVQTYIVRGLASESFETIDTNRASRSGGDILSIAGYKNCNTLSATASLVITYERTGDPLNPTIRFKPTPWEIHQYIESNQKLVDAVNYIVGHRNGIGSLISLSRYSFAFYRMSSSDPFKSRLFTEQFRTGSDLEPGSPVLILRNRYIDDRLGKARMNNRYKLALLFKAWRLWSDGASVKHLRIREEGLAPEKNLWEV